MPRLYWVSAMFWILSPMASVPEWDLRWNYCQLSQLNSSQHYRHWPFKTQRLMRSSPISQDRCLVSEPPLSCRAAWDGFLFGPRSAYRSLAFMNLLSGFVCSMKIFLCYTWPLCFGATVIAESSLKAPVGLASLFRGQELLLGMQVLVVIKLPSDL